MNIHRLWSHRWPLIVANIITQTAIAAAAVPAAAIGLRLWIDLIGSVTLTDLDLLGVALRPVSWIGGLLIAAFYLTAQSLHFTWLLAVTVAAVPVALVTAASVTQLWQPFDWAYYVTLRPPAFWQAAGAVVFTAALTLVAGTYWLNSGLAHLASLLTPSMR